MCRKLTVLAFQLSFVLCLASAPSVMAQSRQVLEQASASLVKIQTADTAASGFIWPDSNHVVTALHVVDGQARITALFVNSDAQVTASSSASIEKVLIDSDLVLLRLQSPQTRPALKISDTTPQLNDSLGTLGFPLNIAGYSNTEVKIRFGGKKLRSILPPSVLKRLGDYPSKNVEILNLESNLVPGLSGAPIIDVNGSVVGIADGGLESGAIGISWGIPASHLQMLLNSQVTQAPGKAGIKELFSADLDADVGRTLMVGGSRLTKLRSRSFAQLSATADDQRGLTQLANLFAWFNPYQFQYDIYQDLASGATIAVPEGMQISQQGGLSVAGSNNDRSQLKFRVSQVQDHSDAQNQSVMFENTVGELNDYTQAVLDSDWSYVTPWTWGDVLVNRKGAYINAWNGYMMEPYKYVFETLATNGATFLGVAAVNHDNSMETTSNEAYCVQWFNDPACAELIASRRVWAQLVLGVQFASIPPTKY